MILNQLRKYIKYLSTPVPTFPFFYYLVFSFLNYTHIEILGGQLTTDESSESSIINKNNSNQVKEQENGTGKNV